jgi:AP2 domain
VRRGGSKNALATAVAWRDQQLAKAKVLTQCEFHQIKRSSNSSGEVGVLFIRTKLQPQGMWQTRLKLPDGKPPTRSFAVKKFGYDEAYRRAVAARKELLELVPDKPFLRSPTAWQFEAPKLPSRINGTKS